MKAVSFRTPSVPGGAINFLGRRPDKPAEGDAYIDQESLELRVFTGGTWMRVVGQSGVKQSGFIYAPYIPLYSTCLPDAVDQAGPTDGVKDFEEV